jgi:molybdenum transport protein
MIYFTEAEIDQLIQEDLPYFDITCQTIKIGSKIARISFTTTHNTVICGMEEVLQIFEKFNITPTLISFSGEQIESGIKFLEGEGLATSLHAVCRTATNIMEFCSGMATRTKTLVSLANEVTPCIPIHISTKSIPFTKKLTIKAISVGGGYLQNLGLSDMILIGDNHIKFLGGIENLVRKIPDIKKRAAGKSIQIKVTTIPDAITLSKTAIDTLQIDQIAPNELKKLVSEIKKINPTLKIAASGEINETNIGEFASTGADILISSYPYYGRPSEFDVNIEPVFELY